jgi:SNF2 family DNA or RNA helicase
MLYYSQIKREFKKLTWKRGQTYFREERVSDVRLDGDRVMGKIKGSDNEPYEAVIVMARGTILNSKCSCPAHREYETHCKHVAALAIWVVERGSLLRSGAGGHDYGVAEVMPSARPLVIINQERAKRDGRLRKLIQLSPILLESSFTVTRSQVGALIEGRDMDGRTYSVPITLIEAAALHQYMGPQEIHRARRAPVPAEAVTFVRGSFQGRSISALTCEPAVRYVDPVSKIVQVVTMNFLTKQRDAGVFRTSVGMEIQVPTQGGPDLPVVGSLASGKVIFQGSEALENLGKLLTDRRRNLVVFDASIQTEIDPTPLKLASFSVGKKGAASRSLSYEFQGDGFKLTSEEMHDLQAKGHLSNEFVWKDGKIYRLATSLNTLSQHSNRSGVAHEEGDGAAPGAGAGKLPGAFGALYDDGEHPLHPLAVYRLSLELGVTEVNVDSDWEEYHDWWKEFSKSKIPALPKVDYGFELRDYQINGLSWMWTLYNRGLSSLLADDMGLGKTHQVLALLTSLYRRKTNRPKLPCLVIAPTSVVAAWMQKLEKYETGLKWHVFHGKGRVMPKKDVELVLTTYGILQREPLLRERDWHAVILDEAQAIKNAGTLSARSARALKAKYRIAMTGTPVENQATDLWSLMEFLIPGYLGSLPRFKRLYGGGRDPLSEAQAQALKRLTSPFLLRRTKSQVLTELPEKTEEIRHCQMTALQKQVYRAYLTSAEAMSVRQSLEGAGKVDYASILALLTRLKQVCDHPKLPMISTAANQRSEKFVDSADGGSAVVSALSPSAIEAAVAAQGVAPETRTVQVIRRRPVEAPKGRGKKGQLPAEPVNAREVKVEVAPVVEEKGPSRRLPPVLPKGTVMPTDGKKAYIGVNPHESGKWEVFEEILNEALGSDLKVVVFTQYLGMMDLIGEFLKSKNVGYTELRGDTQDRGARLVKFANEPECKVFVCSLLAGGLGIDLTAASVCIHMDRWWNPAKENQATDRLHRIGQTRGVQVFKLQIPGSVEDRIAGIIENKLALSDALIEESPSGLKGFSRKQLLDLLNPSADLGEDADEDDVSERAVVTGASDAETAEARA